jgi:hypothetical protein
MAERPKIPGMTSIIAKLSSGWHLARIFRTVLGVVAAIQGIRMHDYAIGILGAFLLYQGLTDTGCCAAGCMAPPPQNNDKKTEDISYEEIK